MFKNHSLNKTLLSQFYQFYLQKIIEKNSLPAKHDVIYPFFCVLLTVFANANVEKRDVLVMTVKVQHHRGSSRGQQSTSLPQRGLQAVATNPPLIFWDGSCFCCQFISDPNTKAVVRKQAGS